MFLAYKYYLTGLGKQVIALGLKLKNLFVIPHLSDHNHIRVLPQNMN